jgi:hypothetical protein
LLSLSKNLLSRRYLPRLLQSNLVFVHRSSYSYLMSIASYARFSQPLSCYLPRTKLKSCLVKHLPNLLAQPCIPNLVSHNLAKLLRNLRNFGALVLSYEFLFTTARTYVIMYVGSIRVMHAIVPWYPWLPHCLTIYPLAWIEFILVRSRRLVLTFAIMSR